MNNFKEPVIVVCSQGEKSSLDIINNIRKKSPETDNAQINKDTIGYKYHNITKYYENDILFLSQNDKSLDLLQPDLLDQIEGLIVYFDANNRDFLNSLKKYATFMESNNIEFGILLCNELFDNSADGITYKEAKVYSNILDVIELERNTDNDDDGSGGGASSHHDPVGYDELLQAIRAIIWSNVDLKRKTQTNKSESGAKKVNDTSKATDSELEKPKEKREGKVEEDDDKKIEAELDGFEQLLTEVMMFKDTTSSWSRSERLAYAEKFAYAFDNLLQNNGSGKKSPANSSDQDSDQQNSSDSDD